MWVNMAPKRRVSSHDVETVSIHSTKRSRTATSQLLPNPHTTVSRELLAQFYCTTQTLREHLLANLPATSRIRRRKLLSSGRSTAAFDQPSCLNLGLAAALDGILVCSRGAPNVPILSGQLLPTTSQMEADESYVTDLTGSTPPVRQSEVRCVCCVRMAQCATPRLR